MGAAGVAYYEYASSQLEIVTSNEIKYQQAVQTQQAAINDLQAKIQQQDTAMLQLQNTANDAEIAKTQLENKFRTLDLNAQARANSQDLENRINKATSSAFKGVEDITKPASPIKSTPTKQNGLTK